MANIPLKSIKFPGLSDTYTIPQIDNTLTQEGQAADAKVVGDKFDANDTSIEATKTGENVLSSSDIIQGSYNATGAVTVNSARIRNAGFLRVLKGQMIRFVPGSTIAQFLYGTFTTEKTFVSDSTWTARETEIPINNDGYIIAVFANAGKTDITPADYDATFSIVEKWVVDVKKTDDKITGLKEDLNEFITTSIVVGENIYNPELANTGYYWTDGYHNSGSYINTGFVRVEGGKTYTLQTGVDYAAINRQIASARFCVYYAEDKSTVIGSGSYVTNIVVPTEASYFIASYNLTSVESFLSKNPAVFEGTQKRDYTAYFEPYTDYSLKDSANSPQTIRNTQDIAELQEQIARQNTDNLIFEASAVTLAANTNLIVCERSDNKKNEYIELTADFTTFDELTIAHGKGSYMGMYFTITNEKIIVYTYNGTQVEEFPHGLTLSDFINVVVYTKNDSSCRSKITIMSAGGDYTAETTRFYSCRAAVLCNATFAMTNVQMRYTVNDGKEDTWVFGDSYISLGDPNRWAHQFVSGGHTNLLLCGFGGAGSNDEIVPFRTFIAKDKPKYLVWALGMNDGDTNGAVNANWKACVDEVIATCEEKHIIPILATIPNVPNIVNTYKNAYVKASGCRYVDFAKAVNAESAGATWYTGMLSSDNVHPTALGAKALMRQFMLNVPEALYAEN